MRRAVKKMGKVICAYQLGMRSPTELKLLEDGRICMTESGGYELFSREAVNGKGEKAEAGDYFKIDSAGYPYPNSRDFFEKHHERVGENRYVQISFPVTVWKKGEPMDEVIRYLFKNRRITIKRKDKKNYFHAFLWGAPLSAKSDAFIVIYDVKRGKEGEIEHVDFNFVAKEEFEEAYDYVVG